MMPKVQSQPAVSQQANVAAPRPAENTAKTAAPAAAGAASTGINAGFVQGSKGQLPASFTDGFEGRKLDPTKPGSSTASRTWGRRTG